MGWGLPGPEWREENILLNGSALLGFLILFFVSMKRVLGADSSGWWLSNSVEILRASGLSDPKGSRGL